MLLFPWPHTHVTGTESYAQRDTSRNAWNRHCGSFMDDTGSYQTIRSSPLTNNNWHSVAWPYTMTALHRPDFIPNHDPITELNLHQFMRGSIKHLQGVWHFYRGCLLLRTPGPVLFGTCISSTCWAQSFFPNMSLYFHTMRFEYLSELSRFCFAIFCQNQSWKVKTKWSKIKKGPRDI